MLDETATSSSSSKVITPATSTTIVAHSEAPSCIQVAPTDVEAPAYPSSSVTHPVSQLPNLDVPAVAPSSTLADAAVTMPLCIMKASDAIQDRSPVAEEDRFCIQVALRTDGRVRALSSMSLALSQLDGSPDRDRIKVLDIEQIFRDCVRKLVSFQTYSQRQTDKYDQGFPIIRFSI